MCPYGSVSLHLCHEDRPHNPELKDSEERLPSRPLESGASTADSRIFGFGGAFGHPAAGRQSTERRVKCVLLIGAQPLARLQGRRVLDRRHSEPPAPAGVERAHEHRLRRRRGRDLEAADLRRMRRNAGRLLDPGRKQARRPVDRLGGRRRKDDPRILTGQRRKRLQAPRHLKPARGVDKRELPADPAPEGPAAAEPLLRQNRGDPLALRRSAQDAADLGLRHGRIGCTAEIALYSAFYRDMVALASALPASL